MATTNDPVVDIAAHDGSANGLKLAGTLVTATASEINALDGITASVAELNILDGVTATAAEINTQCDVSVNTESIDAGGVVSVTKRVTKIVSTGAGAVTLAAPDASMLGQVKIIEMTTDGGTVTLALTNVKGGSAATTATFDDVQDALVLVAGTTYWYVCSETATLS